MSFCPGVFSCLALSIFSFFHVIFSWLFFHRRLFLFPFILTTSGYRTSVIYLGLVATRVFCLCNSSFICSTKVPFRRCGTMDNVPVLGCVFHLSLIWNSTGVLLCHLGDVHRCWVCLPGSELLLGRSRSSVCYVCPFHLCVTCVL